MYGLVNKAIESLIRSRYGDDHWLRIERGAGIEIPQFIGMDAYPDEVTYALVGAASAELAVPAAELLEALGEYWTRYTASEGYGELLGLGGSTFKEFLLNLHNLHTHVALSFPNLTPPSFWCTDVTDGSARLHYHSTRDGLAPMVVGLLRGLGTRFDTEVDVVHDRRREAGAAHDEFQVTFRPRR